VGNPLASHICTLYGVFNHRWPPSRKHRLQYIKKPTAFTDPLPPQTPRARVITLPFLSSRKMPKTLPFVPLRCPPSPACSEPPFAADLPSSGSTVFTEQCSQVLDPPSNRPQTTKSGAGIKNCAVYHCQSHQKEGLTGSSRLVLGR